MYYNQDRLKVMLTLAKPRFPYLPHDQPNILPNSAKYMHIYDCTFIVSNKVPVSSV